MSILIAPHQFPSIDREVALAAEFGLPLVVAKSQQDFSELVGDATIVLVTPYATVGPGEIAKMTICKGIVRYGIGYDNIDVPTAVNAGIPVSIVPDASTEEVASHALALGLMLLRRIPSGQSAIQSGNWASSVAADLPVLSQTVVGVVGLGRIGRLVAQWWLALGAIVRGYDPVVTDGPVDSATLDEILTNSDVVTLHLPLNSDTRHMISSEVLSSMKRGAILVNVSRGGLIDEVGLASALSSGQLAGAGIDVFETEPLPANHPLRNAPNAVLTPHSAWKSRSSLSALQAGAVERARDFLNGRIPKDLVAS